MDDLMDCSMPGSSIHGIFQARVLEWGAIVPAPRDSMDSPKGHGGVGFPTPHPAWAPPPGSPWNPAPSAALPEPQGASQQAPKALGPSIFTEKCGSAPGDSGDLLLSPTSPTSPQAEQGGGGGR